MVDGLKWLIAGLLVGVIATLLVQQFTTSDQDLPERIAEELGCSDGVHPSTAAAAHHSMDGPNGFSWFSVTYAERILGINGCDPVGPAVTYLEFSDQIEMQDVLATLDNFGAVCVVGQSVFEGKLLDGRAQLSGLCDKVGGKLEVLRT
jgi:hypothetical protein